MYNYFYVQQLPFYLIPSSPILYYYPQIQNVSQQLETYSILNNQMFIPSVGIPEVSADQNPVKSSLIMFQKLQNPTIICQHKEQENSLQNIQNRNVFPNNVNLLQSYIRRINKSGKIVDKLIKKYNQTNFYNTKKFYSYELYLKDKVPSHKNRNTLHQLINFQDKQCKVFSLEEQRFYNMICRTLIYNFLRQDFYLPLLNSKKILRTSKKDHLKVRRYLQKHLMSKNQSQRVLIHHE